MEQLKKACIDSFIDVQEEMCLLTLPSRATVVTYDIKFEKSMVHLLQSIKILCDSTTLITNNQEKKSKISRRAFMLDVVAVASTIFIRAIRQISSRLLLNTWLEQILTCLSNYTSEATVEISTSSTVINEEKQNETELFFIPGSNVHPASLPDETNPVAQKTSSAHPASITEVPAESAIISTELLRFDPLLLLYFLESANNGRNGMDGWNNVPIKIKLTQILTSLNPNQISGFDLFKALLTRSAIATSLDKIVLESKTDEPGEYNLSSYGEAMISMCQDRLTSFTHVIYNNQTLDCIRILRFAKKIKYLHIIIPEVRRDEVSVPTARKEDLRGLPYVVDLRDPLSYSGELLPDSIKLLPPLQVMRVTCENSHMISGLFLTSLNMKALTHLFCTRVWFPSKVDFVLPETIQTVSFLQCCDIDLREWARASMARTIDIIDITKDSDEAREFFCLDAQTLQKLFTDQLAHPSEEELKQVNSTNSPAVKLSRELTLKTVRDSVKRLRTLKYEVKTPSAFIPAERQQQEGLALLLRTFGSHVQILQLKFNLSRLVQESILTLPYLTEVDVSSTKIHLWQCPCLVPKDAHTKTDVNFTSVLRDAFVPITFFWPLNRAVLPKSTVISVLGRDVQAQVNKSGWNKFSALIKLKIVQEWNVRVLTIVELMELMQVMHGFYEKDKQPREITIYENRPVLESNDPNLLQPINITQKQIKDEFEVYDCTENCFTNWKLSEYFIPSQEQRNKGILRSFAKFIHV